MKSNDSGTEEWSSDMAITDETLSHSPVSNTLAVSKSRRRSGNPVKYAAKAVAGVFIDCFTPPEDDDPPKSRKKKSNFQQLKSSSGSSLPFFFSSLVSS